jgi:membrane-associated phospholipid phosphatase
MYKHFVHKYNFKLMRRVLVSFILLAGIMVAANLWLYFTPSYVEMQLAEMVRVGDSAPSRKGIGLLSNSVYSMAIVVIGYAAWQMYRRRLIASLMLALTLALLLIIEPIKLIFQRPRPLFDDEAIQLFWGTSFPSGHSVAALLMSGVLALVYLRTSNSRHRTLVLSLAVIYALLIGWSRVYLGAHYPSDVLGGFALGATLLLMVSLLYYWLTARFDRM